MREEWNKLSDGKKKPYFEKAENDKKRYEAEKKAYDAKKKAVKKKCQKINKLNR